MKHFKVLALILLTSLPSHAESQKSEEKPLFPQAGVLASHGRLANIGVAIPQLPMGMNGDKVPLIGSISLSQARDGQGTWTFTVRNNSDGDLKVSVDLSQYDGLSAKLDSKSYSYKFKKGEASTEKVLAVPRSSGAALILKKWSDVKKSY